MLAIIDYGVGNLFSLQSSLNYLGIENIITKDENALLSASRIILPGVGAFSDAAKKLKGSGLVDALYKSVKAGKPLLGICLGMQLLFDKSYEYGDHDGLGLVSGSVFDIRGDLTQDLKVPHMGWNSLEFKKQSPLLRYNEEGEYVYFVHSFYAKNCERDTVATSEYGVTVTAAVARENVFGTQFHPEKSGDAGLKMLKAFSEIN